MKTLLAGFWLLLGTVAFGYYDPPSSSFYRSAAGAGINVATNTTDKLYTFTVPAGGINDTGMFSGGVYDLISGGGTFDLAADHDFTGSNWFDNVNAGTLGATQLNVGTLVVTNLAGDGGNLTNLNAVPTNSGIYTVEVPWAVVSTGSAAGLSFGATSIGVTGDLLAYGDIIGTNGFASTNVALLNAANTFTPPSNSPAISIIGATVGAGNATLVVQNTNAYVSPYTQYGQVWKGASGAVLAYMRNDGLFYMAGDVQASGALFAGAAERIKWAGNALMRSPATNVWRLFDSTDSFLMMANTNGSLFIPSNGLFNGSVGIGTTTPTSKLEVRDTSGTVTLSTTNGTVISGTELGRLQFAAPAEGSLGIATSNGAAIYAVAGVAFDNTTNATDLVFGTATAGTVVERMRLGSGGSLTVSNATGNLIINNGIITNSGVVTTNLFIPANAASIGGGSYGYNASSPGYFLTLGYIGSPAYRPRISGAPVLLSDYAGTAMLTIQTNLISGTNSMSLGGTVTASNGVNIINYTNLDAGGNFTNITAMTWNNFAQTNGANRVVITNGAITTSGTITSGSDISSGASVVPAAASALFWNGSAGSQLRAPGLGYVFFSDNSGETWFKGFLFGSGKTAGTIYNTTNLPSILLVTNAGSQGFIFGQGTNSLLRSSISVSNLTASGTVTATNLFYVTVPTNSGIAPIVTPVGGAFAQIAYEDNTGEVLNLITGEYTNPFNDIQPDMILTNFCKVGHTNVNNEWPACITNLVAGYYRVTGNITVEADASSALDNLEVEIFVNGVSDEHTARYERLPALGDTESLGTAHIMYLPANACVELQVQSLEGSANDVLIKNMSLEIGSP